MRLKRAGISNFRSIRQATIEFGNQTRLIGGNGCGKSTVIRALELFYAPAKTQVTKDDFFGRDDSKEIEIALTFCDFTVAETEAFESRISDGEMTVTRVFSLGMGKGNGKYHGVQLANPDFGAVRNAEKAKEKQDAYKLLREKYADLESAKTVIAIDAALKAWEAKNPQQCQLSRDDGQFFGFESVAQGKLSAATSFVFVPAVRDASQDVAEGRGTPITMLMDLIVRSAIEARADIQEFRTKVEADYQKLTDPDKLKELGSLAVALSGTLKSYYPDTFVELDWQQRDPLKMPLPAAAIRLNDDGFSTAVDRTGHGLQRALVMTLLQHLASASLQGGAKAEIEEGPLEEPDVILAIEEPELYQHPIKQRHFAKVLDELSTGKLKGLGRRVQVVYCSHSPIFIAMDQFDQVRLLRREYKHENREAVLYAVDMDQVAKELNEAHKAEAMFNGETLRSRLHVIDESIAEGFFSAATVIVEGVSDYAALIATSQFLGKGLEENEISVVVANGKNNIDKPAAVFRRLGIPTFAIWDCDEGQEGFKPGANIALQRLFGTKDDALENAVDRVDSCYACFRVNLESTLKEEIGVDLYSSLIEKLREKYGIQKKKDAQKSPVVMAEIIAEAAEHGKAPQTLIHIVEAIHKCKDTHKAK